MSVYNRLKRWLGLDTTTTITAEHTRYKYKIEQVDGRTRTVEGHRARAEAPTFKVKRMTEPHVFGLYGYNIWMKDRPVFECGASTVLSISREPVAKDVWTVVVDKADGSVVNEATAEKPLS